MYRFIFLHLLHSRAAAMILLLAKYHALSERPFVNEVVQTFSTGRPGELKNRTTGLLPADYP
ncbi:hypothetical protein [Niabella aurantiaca]|uniref:hypothetical protein n=1 Tax=Niabella aurantiaca TaxID=379900 RepID=UPI000380369C|nr:hypothetical protein [Niabella aurantiaca]